MNPVCTLNRRILVIDGSPEIHQDFQRILCPAITSISHAWLESRHDRFEGPFLHHGKEPFDLDCVNSGEAGCNLVVQAKAQGSPFAVVFLDVQLPNGWDGIETVERIWDEDSDMEIVLCSAYPDFGWVEGLRRLGHRDQFLMLRKPFDPIEVWQLSTALTMKWHLAEQARLRVQDLEQTVMTRIGLLEKANRRLEQELLRRQVSEVQLTQVVSDLEERNLELSAVRDHALNEIQERERIDFMLRHKTDELARSNRDLEQFASVAAHDLQEPLHSIQVFLDLLLLKYGSAFDDHGLGYVDRVKNAAGRMQQLIQSLLVYSRVDRPHTAGERLILRELVEEILSDLGARIEELKAVVQLGELPTIYGDRFQIRQLLQNLLGNALKFHHPGVPPVIRITGAIIQDRRHTGSGEPGRLCLIEIHDQGIGIPPGQFERIFGMFKRLHRNDEFEGTGIGLAVCQRIVERCGGAISVRSKLGEGSTFIVTLPIQR
ncbi:MAG: ATP-binding protein [Nitrospirales bacterium]|nr:ATP-binding protein [Nitrospirales bacterium]